PIRRPESSVRVSFYTCGPGIVRDDHASRAKGLDPLVVSKNCSPAVEDHGLPAALCNHGHASGVDVTEFADPGVDPAAASTVNTNRLFAEHPTGHVKVVDHQVSKEPA